MIRAARTLAALMVLTLASAATGVMAGDIAPAPRAMPRLPVDSDWLPLQSAPHTTQASKAREISGSASILDSDRLRIGKSEMRLFGVVGPQMSAGYGPIAKTALEDLTKGANTRCMLRDRANDGRYLATCYNVNNTDVALDLLRRGLAATARGSLGQGELAALYLAAEESAKQQKLNLWSGKPAPMPAAPASANVATPATKPVPALVAVAQQNAAQNAQAVVPNAVTGTAPTPLQMTASQNAAALLPATGSVMPSVPAPGVNSALPSLQPVAQAPSLGKSDKPVIAVAPSVIASVMNAGNASATIATVSGAKMQAGASEVLSAGETEAPNLLERYQLLFTGLLMSILSAGIVAALWWQRSIDRREEVSAVAAALRGEMMAARALCQSRLQQMREAGDAREVAWPRIRTLVFQAYVGRIGWLGAELARKTASIYGLASDYVSYFHTQDQGAGAIARSAEQSRDYRDSKRTALQTLLGHMDDVLPRLEQIEKAGKAVSFARAHTALPAPNATPPGGSKLSHMPASVPLIEDKKTEGRNAVDTPFEPSQKITGKKLEVQVKVSEKSVEKIAVKQAAPQVVKQAQPVKEAVREPVITDVAVKDVLDAVAHKPDVKKPFEDVVENMGGAIVGEKKTERAPEEKSEALRAEVNAHAESTPSRALMRLRELMREKLAWSDKDISEMDDEARAIAEGERFMEQYGFGEGEEEEAERHRAMLRQMGM